MTTNISAKPIGRPRQVRVQKVFLALRPNFFNIPDEHITLQYFSDADWFSVIEAAKALRRHVPTEVGIDGFANWKGFGDSAYYEVALINAFETPHLFQHVRTPHITIRKQGGPVSNATFDPIFFGEKQIVDQLWIGKKIKGKFIWHPVENESIMDTAVRGWEIFGNL